MWNSSKLLQITETGLYRANQSGFVVDLNRVSSTNVDFSPTVSAALAVSASGDTTGGNGSSTGGSTGGNTGGNTGNGGSGDNGGGSGDNGDDLGEG